MTKSSMCGDGACGRCEWDACECSCHRPDLLRTACIVVSLLNNYVQGRPDISDQLGRAVDLELNTRTALINALRQAVGFLNGLEQWDNMEIRQFVSQAEQLLVECDRTNQ